MTTTREKLITERDAEALLSTSNRVLELKETQVFYQAIRFGGWDICLMCEDEIVDPAEGDMCSDCRDVDREMRAASELAHLANPSCSPEDRLTSVRTLLELRQAGLSHARVLELLDEAERQTGTNAAVNAL